MNDADLKELRMTAEMCHGDGNENRANRIHAAADEIDRLRSLVGPPNGSAYMLAQETIQRLTTENAALKEALDAERLAYQRAEAAFDAQNEDILNHAPQDYISGYLRRQGIDVTKATARIRAKVSQSSDSTRKGRSTNGFPY